MSNPEAHFTRHLLEDPQGRGWLDYRLAPGGTAEIVNIEVSSAYRRQGVGKELLSRMIAELPPETRAVYAFTSAVNPIAHEWYMAMGFELNFVPKLYFSMNEDAYCCVKVLPKR